MKKHKKILIIYALLLLIVFGAGFLISNIKNVSILDFDDDAVTWDGNQNLLHQTSANNNIAIPGFDSLVFVAGQTTQSVNIYNPEENDCLFLVELYADDILLWQSGYFEPGTGYYTIDLSATLDVGTYAGRLHYSCFLADGTALNDANVAFDLIVQEE